MKDLDSDVMSRIILFTGQEHWPILSLVSQSYNALLNDTLTPLVDKLITRCSRVHGLEKCILTEGVARFYVRASWRSHRRYNKWMWNLLRSRLPILGAMSREVLKP